MLYLLFYSVKSYLGLGCKNGFKVKIRRKKMKTEEIFNRLQDRNRHILGYGSNELSIDIPTLFACMIIDEIEHMKPLVEFRNVIQKSSTS